MPIFTPVFIPGLHVRIGYFWIIVFLTMEDTLVIVKRLDLVDFPIRKKLLSASPNPQLLVTLQVLTLVHFSL